MGYKVKLFDQFYSCGEDTEDEIRTKMNEQGYVENFEYTIFYEEDDDDDTNELY